MDKVPPLHATGKTRRFHYLLGALLGQLVVSPFLVGTMGLILQDVLFLAILLGALRAVRQSRFFRPMLILSLICSVAAAAKYLTINPLTAIVSDLLGVCMVLFTTIVVVRSLIQRPRVDMDTVFGGLCVYLFIGAMWFALYALVERLAPGSFSFTLHGHDLSPMTANRLLFFFSYVTLLTTGYGDVVPLSPVAQTLSIIEGLAGQFYTVFFMARLVGLYVAGKAADDTDTQGKG